MKPQELTQLNIGGVQLSRRDAVRWVMAAVAASALPARLLGERAPQVQSKGYGRDPDLLKTYTPGDMWPLTFTAAQRQTATMLADLIIPKDHLGPAASEVGVPAMLDEWVSAPYPEQQKDRPVILDGLTWLDDESRKRFSKTFSQLREDEQRPICDDICWIERVKPEFRKPAEFFSRFRALCSGAYYSTTPGWAAIGYVGNVALPQFDGPPPEVLQKLGVTQTVRDEAVG